MLFEGLSAQFLTTCPATTIQKFVDGGGKLDPLRPEYIFAASKNDPQYYELTEGWELAVFDVAWVVTCTELGYRIPIYLYYLELPPGRFAIPPATASPFLSPKKPSTSILPHDSSNGSVHNKPATPAILPQDLATGTPSTTHPPAAILPRFETAKLGDALDSESNPPSSPSLTTSKASNLPAPVTATTKRKSRRSLTPYEVNPSSPSYNVETIRKSKRGRQLSAKLSDSIEEDNRTYNKKRRTSILIDPSVDVTKRPGKGREI